MGTQTHERKRMKAYALCCYPMDDGWEDEHGLYQFDTREEAEAAIAEEYQRFLADAKKWNDEPIPTEDEWRRGGDVRVEEQEHRYVLQMFYPKEGWVQSGFTDYGREEGHREGTELMRSGAATDYRMLTHSEARRLINS